MTSHLELLENLRVPHVNVSGALALAQELLIRVPVGARRSVRIAAQRVRHSAVDLHHAWRRATPSELRSDPRPVDQELDAAWLAIHDRLRAYAEIETQSAPRAQQLLDLLFGEGLAFLDAPYTQQWAESRKRLDALAERGLREALRDLCGAEFVDALEAAQTRYSAALGMGAERSNPPPATQGQLRALRAAIANYAVQVAACVDPDDAAAVDAAERTLQPILARRNQAWIIAPPGIAEGDADKDLPYVDLSDLLD